MNQLSFTSARELLRSYREHNIRESSKVVSIWQSVLARQANNLGKEKFAVVEQVYIASLDCNRLDVASECFRILSNAFPGSLRVKKLRAMQLEAFEKYEEALDLLESIIKVDKANNACRKRKVAIYKAQGRSAEAIKELTDYLKIFAADGEAWQELSELYMMECEWAKAAFCVEELILQNPHNHLLYQRYADIKYTQGGGDNLELALKYYYQAVKLSAKNLRALYGLYLCAINLTATSKASADKKNAYVALSTFVRKKIEDFYAEKKVDMNLLNNCFTALQI